MKFKLGIDDSLDVLGVHGVGGVIGMVLLGLFATKSINAAGTDGLLQGGGFALLGNELLAVFVTASFSFGVTWLIAQAIAKTIGLRVSEEDELKGLDLTQHAESAYSGGGSGRFSS